MNNMTVADLANVKRAIIHDDHISENSKSRYIDWVDGFISAIFAEEKRRTTPASTNVNHIASGGMTLCGLKDNGTKWDANKPICDICDTSASIQRICG